MIHVRDGKNDLKLEVLMSMVLSIEYMSLPCVW